MQSVAHAPLILARKTRHALWLLLAITLLMRLLAMIVIPLTDSSEARYGEIARKMVETGNWITPQFDYGVPFWAKPPLSTWLSAIGIKLFGVSEFSVRIPSLLISIAVLVLIWRWIAPRRGRDHALLVTSVLACSALFAAAAGAVMTDPSLLLCTTLAMISFWNAVHQQGRHWGYVFFASLGVGLLAKGPLILVLAALPISVWMISRREWKRSWQQLPWLGGALLTIAIAAPWYWLAEQKTPGFLQYFIVGEHISRFLHPGWTGDKYGNSHATPIGMIWVYLFYAAFPFSLITLCWLVSQRRQLWAWMTSSRQHAGSGGWRLYLLLWTIMPLCFFTMAGNVIWPYPLTALPAFACLFVEMGRHGSYYRLRRARRFIAACTIVPLAGCILIALHACGSSSVKSSQKALVDEWLSVRPTADSQLVYFLKHYPSAMFYSHGKVRTVRDSAELEAMLRNPTRDFVAIKKRDRIFLSPLVLQHFQPLRSFGDVALLQETSATVP